MNDCIFCKIIAGEIPSKKVYEDDLIFAFHDINPQTDVHILLVPKTHIASADGVNEDNSAAVARIFEVIPRLADALRVSDNYRIISNCGESVGQTVRHLHFHLLSGAAVSKDRLV
ncbi:histidine triad nucleotide-binding protein [Feifania hominis]|uniref:Histidine triad nucleotide-binding protein n=1 Tax=Feifania hominis TaxID=2763660 RepID=A0A926HQA4_9FIRM|nr:histidine triad nucleotide-binding protein [Feifania hominis]MBC8536132.1 histidine triad nucleotide-binding protein [Feifania hominis]